MIKGRSIWSLLAFIVGFFVFARIRSYGDNTGIPIRIRYPVSIDHWLFNGQDPVTWLQHRLGQTNQLDALDYFLVIVYISYFVVPPATVLLLWWFRSRNFPLVGLAIMATLYLGLAINFIVPTAPPWIAAEHGLLAEIPRIVPRVLNSIVPGIFKTGDNVGGANDVAAMPSLHIAVVTVISYYFMTRGRVGIVLGVLYILAMSFALVYLGEHYFSDIVAGIGVALVSWVAVKWALIYWNRRNAARGDVVAEEEAASRGAPD
jgi:membrane-associated phospholipid phosphatase